MGHQSASALQQSADRVTRSLASFLPGIVALLLAVLFFALVGWALSALVTRLLRATRFDERVQSQSSAGLFSLAEWSPNNSPTQLFAGITWWVCLLAGLAVGISALNASYATGGVSLFLLPYVTHTAGAILIVLAGALLSRFLSRSILIGAVNAHLQYARFLALGVKWLVLVLTGAMALEHLQIGGTVVELAFGILFGGIVLTLALAIGLGSRELVSRSIERNFERGTERGTERGADRGTERGAYPGTADRAVDGPIRMPGAQSPHRPEQPTGTLRHF